MKIEGVKAVPSSRVVLDEFFNEPTWVDIKIISPYGKAQIREVMMSSFTVGEIDGQGHASSIQTKFDGMADRELKIRNMELSMAYLNTNMRVDGAPAVWGKELWDALDESNPAILELVIDKINETSKLNPKGKEGDQNPI